MQANTKLAVTNKIEKLRAKDPVANAKIIKKLERLLRKI